MWALGVVLYELMALRMPFNATDMKGLMYKILRVMYDPPPLSYSSDIRGLVPKLLVKEPRNRLTAKQVLEQPVVAKRLQLLLNGISDATVPRAYMEKLVNNGLFDPDTEPTTAEIVVAPPTLQPESRAQRRSSLGKPERKPFTRRSNSEPPVPRAPAILPVGARPEKFAAPKKALVPPLKAGKHHGLPPVKWPIVTPADPLGAPPPSNKLPALRGKSPAVSPLPTPVPPPAESRSPGQRPSYYRPPYRRNLFRLSKQQVA